MITARLDAEAAQFPHDRTGSWGDEIHKLFVKLIHIFIISTRCHVFIAMLSVSVKDLLHPNLLVLVSRYSFGYIGPVLHHILSVAELKDLIAQPVVLFKYINKLLLQLHHHVMVLFR
jgi:hypothetical protein